MFLLIIYPEVRLKFCKIISASIIYSVYFVQPSRAEGRIRIRTYNNDSYI
jgi:hypothetical protein